MFIQLNTGLTQVLDENLQNRLGAGYLAPIDWMSKTNAVLKAMKFAKVYEELNQ